MERIYRSILVSISSLLAAGCMADPGVPGEGEGYTEPRLGPSALNPNALNPNALNPNALNPNALNPNALNPNALVPNALNPNSLAAAALAAIKDPTAAGDLSRQLLQYTVSCALDNTQSFAFSWTDSQGTPHNESYPGLLGLAPTWATQSLGVVGQRWVSACLASRVNWYGTPVMLSSRGWLGALATSDGERTDYPNLEGAFFGNLFSASPALYACNYAPDNSHSRSLYRDCAAGHLNADGTTSSCGMVQILGSCSDICIPTIGAGNFYPACTAGNGQDYLSVVTTYLQ